jgi:hypothetical protein
MIISGYPLAFPQNIVLVAASLRLGTVGNNGRKEQTGEIPYLREDF